MATITLDGYGVRVEGHKIEFWQDGVGRFEPIDIPTSAEFEETVSLIHSRFYEVGIVDVMADKLCSSIIRIIGPSLSRPREGIA